MKLLHWLDEHFEEMLLVVLLGIMTLLMGFQICFRYLLNHSLSWSEELIRYLFIWMSFLSISYCIKKWISIKIDQFINLLPKHWYVVSQFLLNLILFSFFLYLSYYAFFYLQAGITSKQTSPALGIPMYLVQCAPFTGFVLASIRTLQQVILEIQNMIRIKNHQEIISGKGNI